VKKTYVVRIVSSFGKTSNKYDDNTPILSAMMDVPGYSGLIRNRSNEAQYLGANTYGHEVYCCYMGYTNKAALLKAVRQTIGKHYGKWGTSWADEFNAWKQQPYVARNFEV
jgi:uncharacterized protein YfaQ (DUF2300 family)